MNETRHREIDQRLWRSLGVAPTEYRLDLNRIGTTIRVQEVGTGPPVVFVHGGSISGTSWASLAARLPDFRCVMIDRPGCGLSEPLATTFHDVDALGRFAEDLTVDVLDGLGLERAHLVATSFGGYLALRGAAAHPARIHRMVEFGWPIGAPVGRTPAVMRVAAVPAIGRLLASIPPNERAAKAILRGIGLRQALEAGRITQEMLDWFLSLLRDTDTMRNELKAGPRIIHPVRGMNRRLLLPPSLLSKVSTPLYFLWGEEDPLGGADIARSFVKHFPNAELELMPGAGHAVWMDDADKAAATARRFLSGEPLGT
jgi:2-hydroxy-6-oxonona-2,4-dienedioate hydrolase